MPHQCVHCGKFIEKGSKELLEGCSDCHGKFFFYIRDDRMPQIKQQMERIEEFNQVDKQKIETDVRNILGIEDDEEPVILDLESVRVIKPGKFEIDLVSLFNRKPIVFKLEEGKYIIDLGTIPPGKVIK